MAGILSVGLLALATVANATPTFGLFGQSCSQVGTNTQQGAYSIKCGVDRPGGDISVFWEWSFTSCQADCDNTSGCQGFTYDSLASLCHLKGTLYPEVLAPSFGAGIIATTQNGYAQTAEQLGGNGATYNGYQISCSQNMLGGDSFSEPSNSFSYCIDRCNSLPSCLGLAFRTDQNVCYYKTSLGGVFTSDGGCNFASNPNKVAPTSTTSKRATTTALPTTTALLATTALPSTTTIATIKTTTSTTLALPTTTTTVAVQPVSTTQITTPAVPTTTAVIPVTTTVKPSTSSAAVTTSAAAASSSSASTTSTTTTTVPVPSPSSCLAVGNGATLDGEYTTYCGTDFPGGDLSNTPASSFAACGPICDQTAGCIGYAYVGGNNPGVCYLKSSKTSAVSNANVNSAFKNTATPANSTTTTTTASALSTSQAATSALSTSQVATSAAVSTSAAAGTASIATSVATSSGSPSTTVAVPSSTASPGSCASLGSGSLLDGEYTTYCGTDFPGGDLSNTPASSFSACGPICDQTPGCIGFAYVGGNNPGVCYLKSSKASAVTNANVNSAFKNTATPSNSTTTTTASAVSTSQAATSAAASTSAAALTSAVSTSQLATSAVVSTSAIASTISLPVSTTTISSAASSTASPGSCASLGSGSLLDGEYTTYCGTDFPGGDLSNTPASSFSACGPICDQTAGCIGFAYVGGNNPGVCYLKSSKASAVSNPNVDSAFKPSAGASLSSILTTTVTVTQTPSSTLALTTASPVYTCLCRDEL